MASQSYRNIIAALSICEGCAVSIGASNAEEPAKSKSLAEVIDKLRESAREAREQWPAMLTQKEADKITESMRKAASTNPFPIDNQPEYAIYCTSIALGLLDELFQHIRDTRKLEHLERVERSIWHLHNHFDSDLDRFAIYEHASRAVSVWLECLNG